MPPPAFFPPPPAATLADILAWSQAQAPEGTDLSRNIRRVMPLDQSGPEDLIFLDNPKYLAQLETTQALACLITPSHASRLPSHIIPLSTPEPYRALALVLSKLYPDALRPTSFFKSEGISPGAFIHPEARLEEGVVVDPGAVIGPGAEIGSGTVIGAHSVIGPEVRVGRLCAIGPHVTIQHAFIGNRVILHPGIRIGQDGFGFVMGAQHLKVPQIGRVIIQDDVEIGANTTIDRGAMKDTIIGEGTQIDNLVQIAHNVRMGRHCVIVSQVGISGSTEIGDYVAIGGQAGVTGHLKIGTGAQIAAQAGVMSDVPAGEKWGGAPAQPLRKFFKSMAALERLAHRKEKEEK